MEISMTWGNNPTEFEMTRQAESMVEEVYRDYRNRGFRAEHALEQTALNFDITQRRARSFLEGDGIALITEQWMELRRRFLMHLDDEAKYATRRAAERTARRLRMEQEHTQLREKRR
jgi:shikimate kinase